MGVFYAGTVGRNEFFYKIRWLVHSILAREPKFHADWFRNGHATRKKPKNDKSDTKSKLYAILSTLFDIFSILFVKIFQ